MKRIQLLAVALLSLAMHGTASAHSAIAGSVPGNGQRVSSPEQLMLSFDGEVRLVRLTVNSDNGPIETGFAPQAAAASMFHVPMPPLTAGAYQVNWTILGADGHSVSETFRFTVDPAAPVAAMPGDHSHDAGDHQH